MGTVDCSPPDPGHTHLVHNGKRELTLDELARQQPGMDRLMAEVGPRVHRMYHAGRAGNWALAAYFYGSVVKQLRLCASSRPKYAADISAFLDQDCVPARAAIQGGDGAGFARACARLVDRADYYHAKAGKPYLAWRIDPVPPADLDLTAGLSPPGAPTS